MDHIKVGDSVGVGAQAQSCLRKDCGECTKGREQFCSEFVSTYGSVYPRGEGKSYGGYADYNRTNGHFVFKLPEGLDPAAAAPMLCAGVTMYSPLRQNGCGPGKRVGIIGVGGLGHIAVLFAKAMGCAVTAFSSREAKRDDAFKLGADVFRSVAAPAEKVWHNPGSTSTSNW